MANEPESRKTSITRELVIAAYHALLNRAPENEAVILDKINSFKNVQDLLDAFVNSPEFLFNNGSFRTLTQAGYIRPLGDVEVSVTDEQYDRLFSSVRDQWTILGDTEPFWSVLSNDKFLRSNFAESKAAFYESGKQSAEIIDIFCRRNAVDRPSGVCLEIGCGVGRITRFLADRFTNVIGVDVSEGNLTLCDEYLRESAIHNVNLHLLRDVNEFLSLGKVDFIYSVIVLQHNPPPIIFKILQTVLPMLNDGGMFLFQVPTHIPGYSFNTDRFIDQFKTKERGFEMHSIPMRYVLGAIEESGVKIKEVVADTWSGSYGSHTFFGVK